MFDSSGKAFEVERVQAHPGGYLVRFAGMEDRTGAEAVTGTELFIANDQRRPLDDGEYWPDELIGLTVRSHDGRLVGVVIGVVEGAAQVRLDIEGDAGRFEVPFVAALVPEVDTSAGVIVLADVPGLVPGD